MENNQSEKLFVIKGSDAQMLLDYFMTTPMPRAQSDPYVKIIVSLTQAQVMSDVLSGAPDKKEGEEVL